MKTRVIIITGLAILLGLLAWSSYYFSYEQRSYRFLKENMDDYGWIDKYLTRSDGDTIDFSPYRYETLYIAKDSLDSLRKLYAPNALYYPDNKLISKDSLTRIVKNAIRQWETSPYAIGLSFEEFCEYLLPYRGGDEELSDFSDTIHKRYNHILKQANPQNPIAAASIINDDMKKWIKFDLRSHAMPSEPSVIDLMRDSLGSCRALSALFVQIMRTMGIPAAIDECPVWAHRNSGHEWAVVRGLDGKWKPFEPAEFNPDGFRSVSKNTKSSKIYRRTYSFNHDFYPPVPKNDIPNTFKAFNRIDVTHEYASTSDIYVTPDINLDQSNGILYLAVFNSDRWNPVAWADLKDGNAKFTNMGNNDIVYLPIFYRNGEIIPAGKPFIATKNGKIIITPQSNKLHTLHMEFQNRYWVNHWDTFATKKGGRLVELYYWDDAWKLCDVDTIGKTDIPQFKNVPKDGLYIIRWRDLANTWQRPFMADSTSTGSRWF